jgi:hypothetical protein
MLQGIRASKRLKMLNAKNGNVEQLINFKFYNSVILVDLWIVGTERLNTSKMPSRKL